MSNFTFNREAMLQVKGKMTNTKEELKKLVNDNNINLDRIEKEWQGKKSKTALSSLDKIKKNSLTLIDKFEEHITYIDEVVKIYDEAGGTVVSSDTFKESISKRINSFLFSIQTNGKVMGYEYNGSDFFVVNTSINPVEYAKRVQEQNLWQRYANGDKCAMISQLYAMDMLSGRLTTFDEYKSLSGAPTKKISKTVGSTEVSEIQGAMFEWLNNGYPVALTVTQRDFTKGRHVVTVIGYDSSVSSADQLTPETILVLDNADGKIQTLSERNREFYMHNGKYRVTGPSDDFVSSIKKPGEQV